MARRRNPKARAYPKAWKSTTAYERRRRKRQAKRAREQADWLEAQARAQVPASGFLSNAEARARTVPDPDRKERLERIARINARVKGAPSSPT